MKRSVGLSFGLLHYLKKRPTGCSAIAEIELPSPTDLFTTKELLNPSIDVPELHKVPDVEASKL